MDVVKDMSVACKCNWMYLEGTVKIKCRFLLMEIGKKRNHCSKKVFTEVYVEKRVGHFKITESIRT